jgi:hypothetical protein
MAAAKSPDETDVAAEWDALAREDTPDEPPHVDSPSIAGDFPSDRNISSHIDEANWQTMARFEAAETDGVGARPWFRKLLPRPGGRTGSFLLTPGIACAAMGALAAALIIWRADIVRLMPQTATFYRLAGLAVNLRGVEFKDVKVTTETVDGKPVLVIEGAIVGETRKAVELPRLRFAVRDAKGTEIYAWNTVLDQTVLKPGQRAAFKSRLASPPAEARSIDIRFFNKRDIAGGSV